MDGMTYGPIRLSEFIEGAVPCTRCGVLCRLPGLKPSEDARIVKYATQETLEQGTAMCLACVITGFLKSLPIAEMITPEKLRWAPFQRQMGELFKASGKEDASAAEIDWEAVTANWDLPLPKAKRKPRRRNA